MIKVHAQAVREECSAMAKEAGRYVEEECNWVYVVIITVYQIQYKHNYYQHIPRKERKCRNIWCHK